MRKYLICFLTLCAALTSPRLMADPHREAATELLALMRTEETIRASFQAVFKPMLENMRKSGLEETKVQAVSAAADEFAAAIIKDPDLMTRIIGLYVEEFTHEEIKDLLAFYKTPTGSKSLEKMPELFQKGATIGEEVAAKHQAEFQKKLEGIMKPAASAEPAPAAE